MRLFQTSGSMSPDFFSDLASLFSAGPEMRRGLYSASKISERSTSS